MAYIFFFLNAGLGAVFGMFAFPSAGKTCSTAGTLVYGGDGGEPPSLEESNSKWSYFLRLV